MPCSETSNGLGNAISHVPARPARRKRPNRGRGRSPRIVAASNTATSGWTFCRTTGVTGSPSHERLREQDRRERRRARADDDARRHVARARAPQRREGGHDDREQDEDEHDVLAEDDRRGLRRLREWTAQQRVGPPQPRRDGDGNDTDGRRSQFLERRDHSASLEVRGDRPQVADEFPQLRVPVVCAQDRRRMDGRDHDRRQVGLDRLTSALRHPELATEERLGGRGAEADEHARLDDVRAPPPARGGTRRPRTSSASDGCGACPAPSI